MGKQDFVLMPNGIFIIHKTGQKTGFYIALLINTNTKLLERPDKQPIYKLDCFSIIVWQ